MCTVGLRDRPSTERLNRERPYKERLYKERPCEESPVDVQEQSGNFTFFTCSGHMGICIKLEHQICKAEATCATL